MKWRDKTFLSSARLPEPRRRCGRTVDLSNELRAQGGPLSLGVWSPGGLGPAVHSLAAFSARYRPSPSLPGISAWDLNSSPAGLVEGCHPRKAPPSELFLVPPKMGGGIPVSKVCRQSPSSATLAQRGRVFSPWPAALGRAMTSSLCVARDPRGETSAEPRSSTFRVGRTVYPHFKRVMVLTGTGGSGSREVAGGPRVLSAPSEN